MDNEYRIKQQIVDIGKRIWQRGYAASNDGNITVMLNDNEILTTPMPKSSLKSIDKEIIEQAVREITEKVLSNLKNS